MKFKEDFRKVNFSASVSRMQKVFTAYTSSVDKRPPLVCCWGWIARQACESSCCFSPFYSFWVFDTTPCNSGGCVHWHWAAVGFFLGQRGLELSSSCCLESSAGKMMEEISIMVAYDAHVFSQLHDEDFLTTLVAISKPRSMVGGALHAALGPAFSFLIW